VNLTPERKALLEAAVACERAIHHALFQLGPIGDALAANEAAAAVGRGHLDAIYRHALEWSDVVSEAAGDEAVGA